MDAVSASSKEDAWRHEGFGSSGRGQFTFHHRSRLFATRMLYRYRQNPDPNKSSPPVTNPEKRSDIDPKEEMREK
jgi:hypothetical protein